MLFMPGDFLLLSSLMAFITSSSVKSSVLMDRVYTGFSCWAGVAGWGWFQHFIEMLSQPCKSTLSILQKFSIFSFNLARSLRDSSCYSIHNAIDRSHIIGNSCLLSLFCLLIQSFSFIPLGTAFDFLIFVHLGLIGNCVVWWPIEFAFGVNVFFHWLISRYNHWSILPSRVWYQRMFSPAVLIAPFSLSHQSVQPAIGSVIASKRFFMEAWNLSWTQEFFSLAKLNFLGSNVFFCCLFRFDLQLSYGQVMVTADICSSVGLNILLAWGFSSLGQWQSHLSAWQFHGHVRPKLCFGCPSFGI